jgi:pSer/pThr/pTyr-binding forkhead associated (FHA) protein
VELARRLAREMEEHKTISVSRVYVPNEYTVYLSSADRAEFASFEASLCAELSAYLAAHARGEGLSLLTDPIVRLHTDSDLRLGEFGIACRMVDPPAPPAAPPVPAEPAARAAGFSHIPAAPPVAEAPAPAVEPQPAAVDGAAGAPAAAPEVPAEAEPEAPEEPRPEPQPQPEPQPEPEPEPEPAMPSPVATSPPTRIYEPLAGVSGTQVLSIDDARAEGIEREVLMLEVAGRRHRLAKRVTRIGRSRDCDVVLADPNVSRLHAEIRHIGIEYVLYDMESTNGVEVNGQQVARHPLAHGDRIVMGGTELQVEKSA